MLWRLRSQRVIIIIIIITEPFMQAISDISPYISKKFPSIENLQQTNPQHYLEYFPLREFSDISP